jgi:hypothetical protein
VSKNSPVESNWSPESSVPPILRERHILPTPIAVLHRFGNMGIVGMMAGSGVLCWGNIRRTDFPVSLLHDSLGTPHCGTVSILHEDDGGNPLRAAH